MLKIAQNPSFAAEVKFTTPGGDGRPVTHKFKGVFKALGLADYSELMARAAEPGANGDALVVDEVLIGWEGVGDEGGTPLPFNAENRDLLMDMMGARAATVRTYINTLTGAREKN